MAGIIEQDVVAFLDRRQKNAELTIEIRFGAQVERGGDVLLSNPTCSRSDAMPLASASGNCSD